MDRLERPNNNWRDLTMALETYKGLDKSNMTRDTHKDP